MNQTLPMAAAAALLAAACATPTPAPPVDDAAAPEDCAAIARRIDRSAAAERSAVQAQSGAWKAIVPMVVAARYATAKRSVEDAQRETADLHAQAARLGCPAG